MNMPVKPNQMRPGATTELSNTATISLLPLPARNERGEGWGEGKPERKCPSSPRPSPPAAGGEGEPCALSAVLSLNSTALGPNWAAAGTPAPEPRIWRRGQESNLPRPVKRTDDGFEDREDHQAPITLRAIE